MSLSFVGLLLGAGALPGPAPGSPCAAVAAVGGGELVSYPPCFEVTLTAEATGQPPLDFTWTLPGGLTLSGNPVVLDTGLLPQGFHEISLRVENAAGSAEVPVHLVVEALGFAAAPAVVSAGGSTVTLRANTTGATEWRWSWGDGTATGWLSGCAGYGPSHTYPGPGSYQVTLDARSCRGGPISWTGTLEVRHETPPSIERFLVVCPTAPFCSFATGAEVEFEVEVSGAAQLYVYDWDGDGADDELAGVPVLRHVFGVPGYFVPRLTVIGAGASVTAFHPAPIEVLGQPPFLFSDGFESGDLRHWTLP